MNNSYLAGLIDGEGYVGIRKTINKNSHGISEMRIPEYKPTIVISNTSEKLMKELKSNFSGSVCTKKISNNTWKQGYSFEMNRGQIRKLIPVLKNKLIIKDKQLEILKEMFKTFRRCGVGHGYTLDEVKKKEGLYQQCLLLNKRGI